MAAELRVLGRDKMIAAPNVRASFTVQSHMRGAWFSTDSARRLAESILSYQTPSGGWSKHVDFSIGLRQPGTSFFAENDGWNFIATFDNNSTTEQLRFLGRAAAAPDERYLDAIRRGVEFLLVSQYPNGCWPQVYPLMGGYHDAATFNDDASVNVLRVLRDVALYSPSLPGPSPEQRGRANAAVTRGVECILASQVAVAGKATIWGQQHDPLTLVPAKARSYEHPSLASRESAGIVAFLMEFPDPVPRVRAAVNSAVDWFRANQLRGLVYDVTAGVVERPGAGPAWARMSEIGTNRPIYSNRDGVVLYDHRLLTDRKTGYLWISTEPASVLADYEKWAAKHAVGKQAP